MKKNIVFAMLVSAGTFLLQHPVPMVQAEEMEPVHTITLPTIPAELKEGTGKDKVLTLCGICHSPDYIPMQPPLPAKTWDSEVHKMIKVFGAPITEEDAKIISSYLAAQYGTDEK
ncbi:MAG: cytochrome c [Desulfobacteraceae bacterium]|jgi:mono/diheme cytochrome c family protein|nr:MAG: cytochrome c [Desulfobacteraceae bacterium]